MILSLTPKPFKCLGALRFFFASLFVSSFRSASVYVRRPLYPLLFTYYYYYCPSRSRRLCLYECVCACAYVNVSHSFARNGKDIMGFISYYARTPVYSPRRICAPAFINLNVWVRTERTRTKTITREEWDIIR